MMSKLRSLLFPANPIPSYSSPSKQMATPFYLLPKSQNSLCLFLLLLMFNPSASAHSSTQQCVDTGLYGLVRVRCRIVRNPVSWLTSRWWLEISHVRDIYTTETKHPPPPPTHTPHKPVVRPLPAHHWVYLPSMPRFGSLLTVFTAPPWPQTWDYCHSLRKALFPFIVCFSSF